MLCQRNVRIKSKYYYNFVQALFMQPEPGMQLTEIPLLRSGRIFVTIHWKLWNTIIVIASASE
jgi:hypothetical protein